MELGTCVSEPYFMAVNEALPSVTVLIAARPAQAEIKAVTASRLLEYPRDKLEIIVARGRQPSVQRNAALRASRGALIYFLDDDSIPQPDNLLRAAQLFADPAVVMVGGPNLCPKEAPFNEQVFALVHASWLAFGPSRARYSSVGAPRESGEKELILCNLLARRDPMLKLGGFNEALYPNEENALMDDLQKRGGKLLYDPLLIVHRRPRNSLKAFAKMLLNYGRGRAEQFRLHPTFGSAANFVPPLFCVYLLLLAALKLMGQTAMLSVILPPLYFYGIILLGQGAVMAFNGGITRGICAVPIVLLTHLLYGIGFWHGMTTPLSKSQKTASADVVLEKLEA